MECLPEVEGIAAATVVVAADGVAVSKVELGYGGGGTYWVEIELGPASG